MNFYNCHTHISTNPDCEIFCSDLSETSSKSHSLGLHPWKASEFEQDQVNKFLTAFVNIHTISIGETGLDRMRGPNVEVQIPVFIAQIEISEKLKLPIILHCVKSWSDILQIRKQRKPKQIWIYHGFTKSSILEEVVHEGLMISIGASILTNKKLQNRLFKIPNDRLLLETDDRAVDIQMIYEKVAELKEISLVFLCEIIEQNCKRIFPKWQIG